MKNMLEKFNQSKVKLEEIQKQHETKPECSTKFEIPATTSR